MPIFFPTFFVGLSTQIKKSLGEKQSQEFVMLVQSRRRMNE
jgi:hypothetical protein